MSGENFLPSSQCKPKEFQQKTARVKGRTLLGAGRHDAACACAAPAQIHVYNGIQSGQAVWEVPASRFIA